MDVLHKIKNKNINIKNIKDIELTNYDEEHNCGIILQTAQLSKEAVAKIDESLEVDWIFFKENNYARRVEIGKYVIYEANPYWIEAIKACSQNVFLYAGEWIWLSDRETYSIESEGKRRTVWIGEACAFQDVFDNTCLKYTLSETDKLSIENSKGKIEQIKIAYARCERSMFKLDDHHRQYINKHNFKTNDVVAIQSVAGSGKTTTLMTLAKTHKAKRILYIAFNKSLITEIKQKVYTQGLKNLFPMTFDSLLYQMFIAIKKRDPNIITLKPQNVAQFVPWLQGKPYKMKSGIIRHYNQFCNDARFTDMEDFCRDQLGKKRPLLEQLWKKSEEGEFHTFENLRKFAQKEHWFNPYIDKTYDMIMIDETQDFDMSMLRMLLDDTTIPKLFVGDPKQSIYEFRGCINAFLHMPDDALKIEFYSTFRVGEPACSIIRKQFSNCWMISKSMNETILEPYSKWLGESYVYLFRNWKTLLMTASSLKLIWINNYEKKVEEIRNLHKKLEFTFSLDEQFEDDLPKFLKSITTYELDNMLHSIESNMVDKDKANIKLFTVHSYKGLESEYVRLSDDIERDEETVYYVALTRGFKRILTPIDVEYFEKLISNPIIKTIEKKEEPKTIIQKTTCVCGGCMNREHTIGEFTTNMGKKLWCMDCLRYGCMCKGGKPPFEPPLRIPNEREF